MAKKRKGDDISRQTIVILLVVAVLISVVGTWLVLTQQPTIEIEQRTGTGLVKFEILGEEQPVGPVSGNSVVGFQLG